MKWKGDLKISSSKKKRIEDIFTLISKRDVNLYKLAIVELNERIVRIDEERQKQSIREGLQVSVKLKNMKKIL